MPYSTKTLGAALLFSLSSIAQAGLIIDTGAGPDSNNGWSLSNTVTGSGQWLGAEFTLSAAHYVTDVQGWVSSSINIGQQFTITVYGDGGLVPDTGNLIYTNKATVTGVQGMDASWEGYHIGFGSGLLLEPGSYWLAFEVRGDDNYGGAMPHAVTSPLARYAFLPASGSWTGRNQTFGLGVRVAGTLADPASVPVPAPIALLGLGLAAIGLAGKKKQA